MADYFAILSYVGELGWELYIPTEVSKNEELCIKKRGVLF